MNEDPTGPTREGKDKIERWKRAQQGVNAAKAAVNHAECELANATNALGKWLTPHDAKATETFCVWCGDSLIQATVLDVSGNGTYRIEVRTRGKSML